jgi:hypothetical protein
MRMTTMSITSAARGAESGEMTSGVRVGRLTVVSSVPTTPSRVKLQNPKRPVLPFRALAPILSEAMTAKRSSHLLALGLLLPR